MRKTMGLGSACIAVAKAPSSEPQRYEDLNKQ